MNIRMIMLGSLAIALAGCTTTGGGLPRNAIESAWNGKSAGTFFAQFGPPVSDAGDGGSIEYTWKGGYKTVRVPAKYAEGANGKKGKRIAAAQTRYLSCTVKLTVDESYTIRKITTISDRAGLNGPSYCAEFLAGAKPAA
ncbi:hypothetical protein [Gellertiella hungarica]|uniref:Lipoprotein n=1 Tax=Gellertiella hungarica TaxID=1572859 RepID=A0A7W6J5K3_9HYPH|nr:hypothetical protein [Gellertiella hungarica]MBB4064412.1 hypothetical protein [Gellertiella hungarica]